MEKKNYFWVNVQLINGKTRWYWCTPKITFALNREKQLNPSNYRRSIIGNYLVVPYKEYSKNKNIEHLTLGKVLELQRSNKRSFGWHQTRSQFLTPDNVGTKLGYQYIRHDYHFCSRVHLFISNFVWGLKERFKNERNK